MAHITCLSKKIMWMIISFCGIFLLSINFDELVGSLCEELGKTRGLEPTLIPP